MRSVKFISIKVFFLFCYLLCLFSSLSAGNDSSITFKDWWEYSEKEKAKLRERWTEKQVEEVFTALKEGKPLPEFFPQYTEQESLLSKNDLRGITHFSQELHNIKLKNICLQGAILMYSALDSADLTSTNLQGAVLEGVSMQGAKMEMIDLRRALLRNADLQGARMSKADIQDANLIGANMREVWLWEANLKNTNLTHTKLQRAQLGEANLEDANLYQAVFDTTYLWLANLGTAKNIIYIIWGDSADKRYVIGEEVDESLTWAKNTYRNLKSFYKKELSNEIAAKFHYRENEIITKSSSWFVRQLRTVFLKWTYDYGSKPIRLLWRSLNIIIVSTVIFLLSTLFANLGFLKFGIVKSKKSGRERFLPFCWGLIVIECFYFSLLSFATFGYGAIKPKQWLQLFVLNPVEYKPVGLARIIVGIEAALGIWIFALLVTVLFGR